ncbi:hypothetical protein GTZ97_02145 [Aquabacterium fontiphilum]|uniref:hypothetical protein n=1 Tax=Aquabacterium fontiphilum TaxID=450365 RepID=UPI001377C12B|nr:hypothetical protein [Aquabacterium fontiphilum]NBD19475.1 hypothetical protein [Aquabacterium fontiphilum]
MRTGKWGRAAGCWMAGAALLATAGCSPELNWREVQVASGQGLVAMFPCKPQTHERTLTLPGLPQPVAVSMQSCQTGQTTWAVSHVETDSPQAMADLLTRWPQLTRENLAEAARQLPVARQVAVEGPTPVTVPGMTPQAAAGAWRYVTERPDGSGRPFKVEVQAWHFAHGMHVYQASVWRPADAPPDPSGEDVAKAFFDGFQFRP